MNPTTAGAPAGLQHHLPRLPALESGQRDPVRRPAAAAAAVPGLNWLKGKHDFRFGGSYVHICDDRTFGAYANAVEALEHDVRRADVARTTWSSGSSAGSRPRSTPKATRAARTRRRCASRASTARTIQRVRALRERQLEPHQPAQGEPRRAVRVLRAADEERSQVRLELLLRRRRAAR